MKITFLLKKNKGVTLLLTCLGVALLIGLPLTYVLLTTQGESANVARAQSWNNSMVVAEAGIEEGMAFINKYAGGNQPLANWTNTGSLNEDVWITSVVTSNAYSKTRTDIFGPGTSYTIVVVNGPGTNVTMKSTGTVPGPSIWSAQSLSRSVQITAGAAGGGGVGGLISKGNVTLSGSAIIDSFNSGDSQYSTNGQYYASLREAHGDLLLANGNLKMTGGSQIFGVVYTNPTNTISMNGLSIGDTNWNSGIQPGYTNNTANLLVPDAPPIPAVTWNPLPPVTVFGNTNQYILDGGGAGHTNYYIIPNGFNLSGSAQMIVQNGTVFLQAQGTFAMSGSSALIVSPNSSVTTWLNGTTALSESGIVNEPGNAANVTFYGTTNCTTIAYSGSSEFIGLLDAPEADIAWSGSAALIGAFVVNSFDDSGSAGIHYDEALAGNTKNQYTLNAWHEVAP
jgi:hypothetical protein